MHNPLLPPPLCISAEVGELHNQAGLLLYMQGKVEEAATHAQVSVESVRGWG